MKKQRSVKKPIELEEEIFNEAEERSRSLKSLAVLCYKHYMNIKKKESEEEDIKDNMEDVSSDNLSENQ